MTDRHSSSRQHLRDTGAGIGTIGRDTGVTRQSFVCSATCACGKRIDAGSLSELRDRVALHTVDCDRVPTAG